MSDRLKMAFPDTEKDLVLGAGRRPPKITRGKGHSIKVRRRLAFPMGVCVGQDMRAVMQVNVSHLVARVAR